MARFNGISNAFSLSILSNLELAGSESDPSNDVPVEFIIANAKFKINCKHLSIPFQPTTTTTMATTPSTDDDDDDVVVKKINK